MFLGFGTIIWSGRNDDSRKTRGQNLRYSFVVMAAITTAILIAAWVSQYN